MYDAQVLENTSKYIHSRLIHFLNVKNCKIAIFEMVEGLTAMNNSWSSIAIYYIF